MSTEDAIHALEEAIREAPSEGLLRLLGELGRLKTIAEAMFSRPEPADSLLTGSCPTWKRQATPSGRSWWVLTTSVHRTGENGSGSLPSVFPTPQAIEGGMSIQLRGGEKTLDHLESHGVTGRRMLEFFSVIEQRLDIVSKVRKAGRTNRMLWPTVVASDAVGAGNRNLPGSKAHQGESLTDVLLGGQAPRLDGRQGQEQTGTNGKSPRCLNHRWTLQLMGYPSDWTRLSAEVLSRLLATRSSRRSRNSSGGRS